MSEYIVGAIIVLCGIGVPLALMWWRKWQAAKAELSWPTTWVHTGRPPPPGIERAMEVIERVTPGMPKAGTIEWVDGPFPLYDIAPNFLVAGTVLSMKPIHIKLMYFDIVEHSALAHEFAHVWSGYTNQGFGESYGADPKTGQPNPNTDPKLIAWFSDVNRQIAYALGR